MIPMADTLATFPSKSPVVNMQPIITRAIETIFFDVILSLKSTYANMMTKTGAELKSIAASDRLTQFTEVL